LKTNRVINHIPAVLITHIPTSVNFPTSPYCASAEKAEYPRRQLSRLRIAEMRKPMPTTLSVDDNSTMRLLMRETLANHPLLSLVEAEDREQALDLVSATSPT
jgi:hypothetical protein